jgi:phosphate transport system permease protein
MNHEHGSDQQQRQQSESAVLARRRDRSTRKSVLLIDKVAAASITVGGLLVILAVVGIMVFLVEVVLPLTGGARPLGHDAYVVSPPKRMAWLIADEYGTLGIRVGADGAASAFHLRTGRLVATGQLDFGGTRSTAVGGVFNRDQLLFGFENGTVRFGTAAFDIAVVPEDALPNDAEELDERDLVAGDAVYTRLPGNQYRRMRMKLAMDEPQRISESPIRAVSYRVGGTVERPTRSFVTFDAAGAGRVSRAQTQINLLTREARTSVSTSELPALPEGLRVSAVAMTSTADSVYVASDEGLLYRFDTRNLNAPKLAETVQAVPDGERVTALEFLVGEQSLVVGGSDGSVTVWFRLQTEDAGTMDGYRLVKARTHESHGSAVLAISPSQLSKAMATLSEDGEVWLRHSTSDQVLQRYIRGESRGEPALLLLPRVNGIVLIDDTGHTDYWRFHDPHPETTLKTIFGKVWYEGYPEPTYTWQSSSGTDVFEPKFSLVPLIFGTVKATVYALLFAVPIALLGAIYTSEFVHRSVRAGVKPLMEMMGSLPTVVLGFIAALILAPIVESWIAAVMLAFVALPLGIMLAAFLWQLLPTTVALRYGGLPKFAAMFAVIIICVWLAWQLGPAFERALFEGDFKGWTAGRTGSGTAFTTLVLWPLAFIAVSMTFARSVGTRYRLYLRDTGGPRAGAVDLGRWLTMLATSFLLAWLVAGALAAGGFDPRGGVVDTYVQRNALVVGFVMGFAVIPNIYTLAEDALNSVPSHLRAASLAAGATPWQTAKWVVLPTAMSGVFAACMIGMGRAVGETMIVLMAAGNTPVLEWNVFSGMRTLSANIAVELPEAVQGDTLYRMLFLAALTLFAMTFVINTVAEVVRQRFRRRAFQL